MDIHIFNWYNTDCGGEIVAYSKAGMKAVDKYVRENYDRIGIKVPKGRKTDIEAFAKSRNLSVNALIASLLQNEMGMSEEEWKSTTEE